MNDVHATELRDVSGDFRDKQANSARDERSRIVAASRDLENAMATASWHRERDWVRDVRNSLTTLQTALRETRESADADGSLFSDVISSAPRFEGRISRIQNEYADLERHVQSLLAQLDTNPDSKSNVVDDTRQRIGWLITALRHVQAKETEVLFEALNVDIGVGD